MPQLATIAPVTTEFGSERRWGAGDVAIYIVGVVGLAASITIMFLGMRAVLNVGGYCAEGGPYVIETHCPEGVALLIPLSVFAGLGSAALIGWKGARLAGPWGALVLLAWPALFMSLGWNFLEFAFFPPPPETGIVLGWLIPGVLFEIMGAFPLLALLPDRDGLSRRRARGQPAHDAAAEGEARYSNELRRVRRRLLNGLVREAHERSSATGPATTLPEVEHDLVSKLERLAALHRAGSLSYDEFQRAKAALLGLRGEP